MSGAIAGHYADFADAADVVAARPIEVLSVLAYNANAEVRYLQFFDATTVPQASAAATYSFPIPGGPSANQPTVLSLTPEWFQDRLVFKTGCVYAFSTTAGTYTAATDGDHNIVIRYRG